MTKIIEIEVPSSGLYGWYGKAAAQPASSKTMDFFLKGGEERIIINFKQNSQIILSITTSITFCAMDKIISLFIEKMQLMCNEHLNQVSKMQQWQLQSLLSKEIATMNSEKPKSYLLERYQLSNPLYLMLKEDLDLIKYGKEVSFSELKIANIDHRYLESLGLKDEQIDDFYNFISKIKLLQ